MFNVTVKEIDLQRLGDLAKCIAQEFPTELVVGLVGTLGAGKTTFTQALASAAGVDPEDVTSPTFTLLCSYDATIGSGPVRLHHLDAYRLSDEDEFLELGVDELFESKSTWVLIEWADRVESVMPRDTLWISIDVDENSQTDSPKRVITLTTEGEHLGPSIEAVTQALSR